MFGHVLRGVRLDDGRVSDVEQCEKRHCISLVGVVCIHTSVWVGGGGVKLYGGGSGVMYDTRGIVGGVVDTV